MDMRKILPLMMVMLLLADGTRGNTPAEMGQIINPRTTLTGSRKIARLYIASVLVLVCSLGGIAYFSHQNRQEWEKLWNKNHQR